MTGPQPEPRIYTREETFAYVEGMVLAGLTDKPIPSVGHGLDLLDPVDIVDGMAAFGRKLAARFDTIPERMSDNVEVQEYLRCCLDEKLAALAREAEALAAFYARPRQF